MQTTELPQFGSPVERVAEAILALGLHNRLLNPALGGGQSRPSFQPEPENDGYLMRVEGEAARLGLDATAIQFDYSEAGAMLPLAAPALLRIPAPSGPRLLLVAGRRGTKLKILTPDLKITPVPLETVRSALCAEMEAAQAEAVENLLDATAVRGRRRERARGSLLEEFLADQPVQAGWILRPAGDSSLNRQFHAERLASPLAALALAYAAAFLLWLASWWLIGQGFLSGYLDTGWLTAWGLTLLTLVPLKLLASYASGLFSARAGVFLKRRLLFGALRLEPDEIRHQGMGQLLGQAMEVETVEQMAVTGGFLGITAFIELAISAQIISLGAGGGWHVAMLVAWLAASVALGGYYLHHRRIWTATRLDLTHDLVEGMVGHRTRAVQAAQENRAVAEDQALEHYHRVCLSLDRASLCLQVGLPRGWFVIGLSGLTPSFVTGGASLTNFAIGLGGLLLAYQAFHHLAVGLERLIAAWVGWETLRPLWRAAARPVVLGDPWLASALAAPIPDVPGGLAREMSQPPPLVECHNLGFRHAGRAESVLRKLNLKIRRGEKILLQGRSGGGKSTLAMVVAGQREPTEGLCLLNGLDRASLGDHAWRRRVVIVPQFHENHIFMGTVAFNLLMGRGWPPTEDDLAGAEALCHALGLGPLLERMPSGLQQWLGETGWQLSHGERDRICIGRALLQGADLLILDESFSALDAYTLRETMQPVLQRDSALIVIAHA